MVASKPRKSFTRYNPKTGKYVVVRATTVRLSQREIDADPVQARILEKEALRKDEPVDPNPQAPEYSYTYKPRGKLDAAFMDMEPQERINRLREPDVTEDELWAGLSSFTPHVRIESLRSSKATELLVSRALWDTVAEVRVAAMESPGVTEILLLTGMRDYDIRVRRAALLSDKATLEVVHLGLRDADPRVRAAAVVSRAAGQKEWEFALRDVADEPRSAATYRLDGQEVPPELYAVPTEYLDLPLFMSATEYRKRQRVHGGKI